ncbi:MAG: hypothetical protein WDA29_11130 [Flavobacteriaceae bacterium]
MNNIPNRKIIIPIAILAFIFGLFLSPYALMSFFPVWKAEEIHSLYQIVFCTLIVVFLHQASVIFIYLRFEKTREESLRKIIQENLVATRIRK